MVDGSSNEGMWREQRLARLIPTSGIKGVDDQETRASSALLAVMMAVPEFARALLKKVDAPAGNVRTYLEIPIKTELGTGHRPDGAIIVTRGSTTWTALIEVKTGLRDLDPKQIESYLDLAKEQGFQAVVSISNHMTSNLDPYPVPVDRKKTRHVLLHHWSWVELLTEAVLQKEFRGISDKDQAWILGELIAYLSDRRSGAMTFEDMGPDWVAVRDGARERTLRQSDDRVTSVVTRWDQFIQYLCLHLGRDLGLTVNQILSRKGDATSRRQYLIRQLVEDGRLDGVLRIPRAAGDVSIVADLRGRMVTMSVDVSAPTDRGSPARLSWLIRQLSDSPPSVRVDVVYRGGKSDSDTLAVLRESAKRLVSDRGKEVRSFVVSLSAEMGMKRGGVRGSFIGETSDLLLHFYREVVQSIRPWSAAPARLPAVKEEADISREAENVVEDVAREQESAEIEATVVGDEAATPST